MGPAQPVNTTNNMRGALVLGNITRNILRTRQGADVTKTRAVLVCQRQLLAESGIFRRTLITSTARLSDDKKVPDQASLAQKVDPKDAAARKAAEEATKKALEKKRIEDAAAAKNEEKSNVAAEQKKKEEEIALAAKKKKEEEAALAAKKKKEEEAALAAPKKKEEEAALAAQKKKEE